MIRPNEALSINRNYEENVKEEKAKESRMKNKRKENCAKAEGDASDDLD